MKKPNILQANLGDLILLPDGTTGVFLKYEVMHRYRDFSPKVILATFFTARDNIKETYIASDFFYRFTIVKQFSSCEK